MHLPVARLHLLKEMQQQFREAYPYLKIELQQRSAKDLLPGRKPSPEEKEEAGQLLNVCMGLKDHATVAEFESALLKWYGAPVQVYRKSGNLWLATRLTRQWTLREQNEYGANMTAGLI